jgi:hypothetical protein
MTNAKTATDAPAKLHSVGDTLAVAAVFVLMARLWDNNDHLVFMALLAGLVGYIAWRKPQPLRHTVVNYVPLALMGTVFLVMAASSLWAPEFYRTFAYSVFSFLHFLIGIAVALAFPVARIVGGIILAVAAISLYGLGLGIVDPERGFTEGLLMGEFTNQSEISHVLGIGLILVLGAWYQSGVLRLPLVFLGIGLVVYLEYLGYLTSFVALAAGVWVYGVVILVRRLRPELRTRGVLLAAGVSVLVAAVLWAVRVPLQLRAGTTPDFSGRIPFWEHFWSLALAMHAARSGGGPFGWARVAERDRGVGLRERIGRMMRGGRAAGI